MQGFLAIFLLFGLNFQAQVLCLGKAQAVDEEPAHEEAQGNWVNDVENRQQDDAPPAWRHLGVSRQGADQAAEAKASGIRRPLQVEDGGQKTGQSRRKQDRDKKLRLLQHIGHLDLWRPDEVGQGGPHPVDAVAHNPQSVGRPSDAQVGGPGGNPGQADRHRDPN